MKNFYVVLLLALAAVLSAPAEAKVGSLITSAVTTVVNVVDAVVTTVVDVVETAVAVTVFLYENTVEPAINVLVDSTKRSAFLTNHVHVCSTNFV